MSVLKTHALVLKSINWSDSSKIVTLFTRDQGRIDVIARGARRNNNPYRGNLESLNHIEAIIYLSDKREIQTLGQISLECSFQNIRSDLEKTGNAFSILELILAFFHEGDGDTVFFDFVIYLLSKMNESATPQILVWYFILKLSSFLGFKPEFEICRSCSKPISGKFMVFRVSEGSVYCQSCQPSSNDNEIINEMTINYLLKLQKTHYRKIDSVPLPPDPAFPYTRFLLSYLKYHTDQPLNLRSISFLPDNADK